MSKRIWDLTIEELAEIGRAAAQDAIRSDRASRPATQGPHPGGRRKTRSSAAE